MVDFVAYRVVVAAGTVKRGDRAGFPKVKWNACRVPPAGLPQMLLQSAFESRLGLVANDAVNWFAILEEQ